MRAAAGVALSLLCLARMGAQTPATELTARVQSDLAQFEAAKPTLGEWRRAHPDEQLKPAAYSYEYETQGLWCAGSSLQTTRLALFYIPAHRPGQPLPDHASADQCRLGTFWYEVHGPALPDVANATAQALKQVWGEPGSPPSFKRTGALSGWGVGYWNPFLTWTRPGWSIVLGLDPQGNEARSPRIVVIARSTSAPVLQMSTGFGFEASPETIPSLGDAAARIADLDPAVTKQLLNTTAKRTPGPLIAWMKAARSLPSPRRAAALVLADLYESQLPALTDPGITQLGAKFIDTREGPNYTHNWRSEAEKMDPLGPGGEVARVARLQDVCSFEGKTDWRGNLIPFGEAFLKDFPSSPWTPYAHYILARTYAARLMLTYYPDGDGASNPNHGILNAQALRRSSVAHFRVFLSQKPNAPEASFAWQESWRLLAGLPPTPISFGCTDE